MMMDVPQAMNQKALTEGLITNKLQLSQMKTPLQNSQNQQINATP
jgi:hypothetical protein